MLKKANDTLQAKIANPDDPKLLPISPTKTNTKTKTKQETIDKLTIMKQNKNKDKIIADNKTDDVHDIDIENKSIVAQDTHSSGTHKLATRLFVCSLICFVLICFEHVTTRKKKLIKM